MTNTDKIPTATVELTSYQAQTIRRALEYYEEKDAAAHEMETLDYLIERLKEMFR